MVCELPKLPNPISSHLEPSRAISSHPNRSRASSWEGDTILSKALKTHHRHLQPARKCHEMTKLHPWCHASFGASPLQLLNRDNLHRCKLACMGSWMHWVTSVAYQQSPKPITLHLYHVRKPWYHHRRLEMEL